MSVGPEKRCTNPPMFRYTWPGLNEAHVCLAHSSALLSVAHGLGVHVQLIQLTNDELMKVILSEGGCSQNEIEEDPDAQG